MRHRAEGWLLTSSSRQLGWVDWVTWQGDAGGRDPETVYRRDVERGPKAPPESRFRDAAQGWLLGRLEFVFGLGHTDGVRNLTRRVDRALPDSSKLRQDTAAIRHGLLKTERI